MVLNGTLLMPTMSFGLVGLSSRRSVIDLGSTGPPPVNSVPMVGGLDSGNLLIMWNLSVGWHDFSLDVKNRAPLNPNDVDVIETCCHLNDFFLCYPMGVAMAGL